MTDYEFHRDSSKNRCGFFSSPLELLHQFALQPLFNKPGTHFCTCLYWWQNDSPSITMNLAWLLFEKKRSKTVLFLFHRIFACIRKINICKSGCMGVVASHNPLFWYPYPLPMKGLKRLYELVTRNFKWVSLTEMPIARDERRTRRLMSFEVDIHAQMSFLAAIIRVILYCSSINSGPVQ